MSLAHIRLRRYFKWRDLSQEMPGIEPRKPSTRDKDIKTVRSTRSGQRLQREVSNIVRKYTMSALKTIDVELYKDSLRPLMCVIVGVVGQW